MEWPCVQLWPLPWCACRRGGRSTREPAVRGGATEREASKLGWYWGSVPALVADIFFKHGMPSSLFWCVHHSWPLTKTLGTQILGHMARYEVGRWQSPNRGSSGPSLWEEAEERRPQFVLGRPADVVFSTWTCEFFSINCIFTSDFSHQMGQSRHERPSGWCVKALGHNKKRSYIKQKGFHVLIQQTLVLFYVPGTENTKRSETTLTLEVLRWRFRRWTTQQLSMFWTRTAGNTF